MRYIVIDTETPNNDNDRMSAIGVTTVEDGRITDDFYTLVDPEVRFDDFNIAFTGITPEDVADAPTFPELWETLCPMIGDSVIVAHNAPFDMAVLAKCLKAYGIKWKERTYYACTVRMSCEALPDLPDHKLDTVSAYLDVDLIHHNAGSDSRACAEILVYCLSHGVDPARFTREYDVTAARTVKPETPGKPHYWHKRKKGCSD